MATTTNYSWVTPDDTSLVKDGASAIRTLGSSVDTTLKALSPGTTAGDIDYYTTSTAKARLGIGTAGQVLTVNGGGTAPSWGAAPSGALNLSSIASGTMSGTAINLTGLTQDFLSLRFSASTWTTASDTYFKMNINNNTSATYDYLVNRLTGNTTFTSAMSYGATETTIRPTGTSSQLYNNSDNYYVMNFYNCKSAGFTTFQMLTYCISTSSNFRLAASAMGTFKTAAAVTSLYLTTNAGYTFNAGNYELIGG
jgi:hypothetical protein